MHGRVFLDENYNYFKENRFPDPRVVSIDDFDEVIEESCLFNGLFNRGFKIGSADNLSRLMRVIEWQAKQDCLNEWAVYCPLLKRIFK